VRLLLDTQCWLWMRAAPQRLSAASRRLLTDPTNELLLVAQAQIEGLSLLTADRQFEAYDVAVIRA
jgi:PIN domain nuclease of toxin-antitoxin system